MPPQLIAHLARGATWVLFANTVLVLFIARKKQERQPLSSDANWGGLSL